MIYRLSRVLLDPTPTDGGGQAQSPPQQSAPTQAAPVASSPIPTINVAMDELNRLRQESAALASYRQEQEAIRQRAEAERLQALADKGKADELLKELRDKHNASETDWTKRYTDLETSYHGEKRAATVGAAVSGVQWISDDAKGQALELLNARLAVTKDGSGATVVVDKLTGRPAAAVIPELLGSAAFAHFQLPKGQGGAGAKGGDRSAPVANDVPPSYEDAVFENWKKANGETLDVPSWMRPARITRRN